jgi:hypothetical protein
MAAAASTQLKFCIQLMKSCIYSLYKLKIYDMGKGSEWPPAVALSLRNSFTARDRRACSRRQAAVGRFRSRIRLKQCKSNFSDVTRD